MRLVKPQLHIHILAQIFSFAIDIEAKKHENLELRGPVNWLFSLWFDANFLRRKNREKRGPVVSGQADHLSALFID